MITQSKFFNKIIGNLSFMFEYLASESKHQRLYAQEEDARHPFERDRDRIIHSVAFRRLQNKTQVFIYDEGDHYRTRLTHSLEVSQIARSIARRLGVNEDLCELVALAHDFGHPPFGHNGEYALQDAAELYGGFDHNAQALRIICMLENKHMHFDGLNLTKESIDAIMKHNGPIDIDKYRDLKGQNAANTIQRVATLYNIDLQKHSSIEAQIAAIADDIAYCNHDIDDGIRAGLITFDELCNMKEVKSFLAGLSIDSPRSVSTFVRRLIRKMVDDVVANTTSTIMDNGITSSDDVANFGEPVVWMSKETFELLKGLKAMLFNRIYNYTNSSDMGKKTNMIVTDLFNHFFNNLEALPQSWHKRLDFEQPAVVVLDYISGMTDRFAIQQHQIIVTK